MSQTKIAPWVQQFCEDVCGHSKCQDWKPGDTVKHPDGRLVEIQSGQYWGTYGVSNFWYWREILPDGSLGLEENGYGWE